MASGAGAEHLTSVLQGITFPAPANRLLTRQQTFPPLQPYVRMRNMSTTAEMTACSEALLEGNLSTLIFDKITQFNFISVGSQSNSSHSSQENIDSSANIVPTITILSPNNGNGNSRSGESLASESPPKSSSHKREPEALDKEKATKIARLSETGQQYEKENVDPRRFLPPVRINLGL